MVVVYTLVSLVNDGGVCMELVLRARDPNVGDKRLRIEILPAC